MHDADVQHQIVRDKNFTFHDLETLANTCFQTNNYLHNFPQVFKNENRDFLFLLRYKNKIASFCSLYPFSFQLDGKRLSAYCIGSVCTHPKFRKLGLAHKAIILAEKKAIENSADFIFLFADNHKLYSKLNFIQAGNTYLAQISSNISNQTTQNNLKSLLNECEKIQTNLNIKNIEIHYQANLLELSENEKIKLWQFIVSQSPSCESILSYLDFCDILKIKHMNIYFIRNEQQILATCFYNKGDDFQNVIHSAYYLNRNYIFLLISKIFLNNKGKEIIFFPGSFYNDFEDIFEYISIPSMSIKTLNEKKFPINTLQNLCIKNSIFVSSLQGT
jgi:Acetyltransferase (GNAT) domain